MEESKRRLYEYENKLQSLMQENERITRSGEQERDNLKRTIMEMKNELANKH